MGYMLGIALVQDTVDVYKVEKYEKDSKSLLLCTSIYLAVASDSSGALPSFSIQS